LRDVAILQFAANTGVHQEYQPSFYRSLQDRRSRAIAPFTVVFAVRPQVWQFWQRMNKCGLCCSKWHPRAFVTWFLPPVVVRRLRSVRRLSAATQYCAETYTGEHLDTFYFLLGFTVQRLYLLSASSTPRSLEAVFSAATTLLSTRPLITTNISHVGGICLGQRVCVADVAFVAFRRR